VNQPITKSVLSEPQSRLVEMLQRLNFGRIEALQVRGGVPVFVPPPRIVQKLKMGGDNAPRPEAELQDFLLKRPTIEMLQAIAELGEGVVLSIDVKHGLPFALEIEQRTQDAGGLVCA
jgi:hypothetical protein